ncbi:MAG: hypothetical protein A4S09_06125 [Proteobacteria bacterium SG_bin7]|nr:MAG: hypothetical protein A4S09_06125 [Proteobacteria bacterium SG_bin7]
MATSANVAVFKYDGSRQCERDSGTSLEAMQKRELKGIKVIKSSKQPDGNMRASVCGGKTGLMNVYEISEKDLNKAEKRGFKKLPPP